VIQRPLALKFSRDLTPLEPVGRGGVCPAASTAGKETEMSDPRIPENRPPNERVEIVERDSGSGAATVAILAIIVLAAGAFFFYGGDFMDRDRDVDITLQNPPVTSPQVPESPEATPDPVVPPVAPAPSGG